jgi:AmmeMemoRadiSam system protein B
MGTIRPAAVAGTFYPASPNRLREVVAGLLAAEPLMETGVDTRLVIVPHAGYIYSGGIAAGAYRRVAAAPASAPRVVLLGPSHFVRFTGLAAPGADALETPLGVVAVDTALAALAAGHPVVVSDPAGHAREHSLEVQLPFLQLVLGDFTALPLTTGEVTAEATAEVLDELIDAPGVLGVISSDLSHYLDDATARRRDAKTAQAIVELRAEDLTHDDACGRTAVQAALLVARRRDWQCRLLALGNSGDTSGPRDRVVGYGSFVVGPAV